MSSDEYQTWLDDFKAFKEEKRTREKKKTNEDKCASFLCSNFYYDKLLHKRVCVFCDRTQDVITSLQHMYTIQQDKSCSHVKISDL